jgi:hypothetical protein
MILAHKQDPMVLLRMLSGTVAFWLGFVWIMVFLPAAIELNSPANARLVPRQRRRLMQMTAAGWLIVTAGVTLAGGEWPMFPAAGICLIGYALMRAGRKAGVLFVVALNWPALSRHLLPPVVVAAVGSTAGLLILSALLLPGGAWALRSLYPAAGDGHLARRDKQLKRPTWLERRGPAQGVEHTFLAGWCMARVYGPMLRLALRRPRPGAMLIHALGPVAHWSAWLGFMAFLLLAGGGVRVLLAWRGGPSLRDFVDGAAVAGLGSLTMVAAFATAAFSQQLRKTAGEQSLLRLTPLAGSAALLNRRLAVELLKGALRIWCMLAVVILLVTVMIGGGREALLREAALCLLGGQLAAYGLLGDFAGDGGWSTPLALQAALAGVAELAVALALDKISGVSMWAWVAAIAVALAAWHLRSGWRTMLAAAPAFPAARVG